MVSWRRERDFGRVHIRKTPSAPRPGTDFLDYIYLNIFGAGPRSARRGALGMHGGIQVGFSDFKAIFPCSGSDRDGVFCDCDVILWFPRMFGTPTVTVSFAIAT